MFPYDIGFIGTGRKLELQAFERAHQMGRTNSHREEGESETPDAPGREWQRNEEHTLLLQRFLPVARRAYQDRGLEYPFRASPLQDALVVDPAQRDLARRCADLSALVGRGDPGVGSSARHPAGGSAAQQFEIRAVRALHTLLGGWGAAVGAPRQRGTGPRRAVEAFRRQVGRDAGDLSDQVYPRSGDFGADGILILGRSWAGPLVLVQCKNAEFSMREIPEEFSRCTDILTEWFGRDIGRRRTVLTVLAANTILPLEYKEAAFLAARPGAGHHILDAVDILHAELVREGRHRLTDTLIEF